MLSERMEPFHVGTRGTAACNKTQKANFPKTRLCVICPSRRAFGSTIKYFNLYFVSNLLAPFAHVTKGAFAFRVKKPECLFNIGYFPLELNVKSFHY